MATSFTLQTKTYGGRYLRLTCTQTADAAANSSQLKWKLEALGGPNCATGPTTVTVAGQMVYYKVAKTETYPYFPVNLGSADGKLTVQHGKDGTLSVPVVLETAFGGGAVTRYSGTWVLDPTDRATRITAGAGTIGGKLKLALERKESSFVHTIHYSFGKRSGWLDANGKPAASATRLLGSAFEMELPESFYDQIPNALQGTGTLTCYTYYNDKVVGSATCSFTAMADPVLCAPTLEAQLRDVNPRTVALTGSEQVLVRYRSDAECTMTAGAKYGATVTKCTIDGVEGTHRIITDCQTDAVRFAVRDSRGLETARNVIRGIIDYVPLTCNVTFKRMDPVSGRAKLTVWGDCFHGSFGMKENVIGITCPQIDAVLSPTLTERGYRLELELDGYQYDDRHTVYVTVTDLLDTVTTRATLPEGLPVFDWGKTDFQFHVPVLTDESVGGVFLRTVKPESKYLRFQSRFEGIASGSAEKQTVFLFGLTQQGLVQGTALLGGNGTAQWNGTAGVSAQLSDTGRVTLTLPGAAADTFTLLSATHIHI